MALPFDPVERAERRHVVDLARIEAIREVVKTLNNAQHDCEDAFEAALKLKAAKERLAIAMQVAADSAANLETERKKAATDSLVKRIAAQDRASTRLAAKVTKEWPRLRADLLALVEALKADETAVRLLEYAARDAGVECRLSPAKHRAHRPGPWVPDNGLTDAHIPALASPQ